ncbi:MAG: hypothetical protein M1830_006881 [Pleopsidium flavum]|nr:MAG: hypothetical protein M1830_006881 [Pleopsidium flavum]
MSANKNGVVDISVHDEGKKQSPASSTTAVLPAPSSNGRPACFNSTVHEVLFVLTTTMAVSMTSFVAGSTMVITSSIGNDLHMNAAEITWISASSSLTAGAFLLFFGRIADMFGRKSIFVGSMALFTIFALVAGFATNPLFMDTFNGLLGLCSAAAVPPAVGTLGSIYETPGKRKNYAFACFSAGNPLGFVFGGILSGAATKLINWRASFWLLAIIYLVFTVVAIFTVPKDQDESEKFGWEALKKFDILGTLCTIAGIALFSSSLSLAGDAPNGWRTPYVIVLLVVGVLFIGIFLWWESIFKFPLMPLRVWRDRNFSLIMAIMLLGFIGFTPAQFWLSLYLQRVQHLSALSVALRLLPQAIMGIFVNIVAGLILHKVSNKLLTLVGAVCYTISFLLLALQKDDSSYWALIFPSLLLMVVGADFQFNVANMYVMSSLPRHQQSVAGGIFNTVTKLCNTIGLGITTAIYTSISAKPFSLDNPIKPYLACFWFSCASAALSICLVPFLQIGTQGGTMGRAEETAVTAVTAGSGLEPGLGGMSEKDEIGIDGGKNH